MKPHPLSLFLPVLALACAPALTTAPAKTPASRPAAEKTVDKKASAAAPAPELTREQIAAEVLAAVDPEADPCVDFYRYACGGWVDSTELPGDESRWVRSFSSIREENRELLRELLDEAAARPGTESSDHQRVGHYYGACMDEEAIEKVGVEPLEPALAEIAEIDGPEALWRTVGKLHRFGVDALFSWGVLPDFKDPDLNIAFFFQGGLGMPDRDYYVSDDETKRQLLADYERHVATMLGLLGAAPDRAAREARAIVELETHLARASRDRVAVRDFERLYNRIERQGLEELTPELPWTAYFEEIGYPGIRQVSVSMPEFFEALEDALAETDLEVLRAYLRWHLVNGTANLLPTRFVEADFDFYGRRLQGQQELEPRWKRCVSATENALGEAVGRVFVEERFAGDSRQVALEMIHDIQEAFEAALPGLDWMDDQTRERALEKARAVREKIGFPDQWRDYSAMKLSPESYFRNAMAARSYAFDEQATKVGEPVDRDEWRMPPQRVNAYYNPLGNEIVFPAGILQPPFFHRDFPAAMNYGAIGAVMGHELTHGFDDQGRKFDPDGRLREWWAPEASERYVERAQCIEELYSGYEVEPGVKVNGELTLGENIADAGGVKQAYDAYQRWLARHGRSDATIGDLTGDQLFFLAYGQVWCSVVAPEQARLRVTTDSHAPPEFRVVGALSNHPAFARAWGCEPGQPMVPENQCEVW